MDSGFDRLESDAYRSKVLDAYDAVKKYLPDKGVIGFSGMAGCGLPKSVPSAIARYAKESGKDLSYTLMLSGSTTKEFEDSLSGLKVKRRYPGVSGQWARSLADSGDLQVFDYWLSEYSEAMRDGVSFRLPPDSDGYIQLSIIEATGITKDGMVIPSEYLSQAANLIQCSHKVIIEINVAKPYLYGLHDVYHPVRGEPIPLTSVTQRIGTVGIPCPESKVAAIVFTESREDISGVYQPASETDRKIAQQICEFLSYEVKRNPRLRDQDIVMQNGPSAITNFLADYITEYIDVRRLSTWSEVTSAKWVSILGDQLKGISGGVILALPGEEKYKEDVFNRFGELKKKLVLRETEITNSLELIHRLGVLTMQHAIEMDIYGNVNVSHIAGKLYNGVGGSGDFCKAGLLTIVSLPSTASGGKFSRIVPIASHVDIVEHDVDVVVTEHGWADLRGLSPRERAVKIIEECADPSFKDSLRTYFEKAKSRMGGHEPIDMVAALDFYQSSAYPYPILGASAGQAR